VDVVGRGEREVVVHHRAHPQEVHAAAHEVRGHEHPGGAAAESVNSRCARGLALARVDAARVHARVRQLAQQRRRAVLRRDEDEDRRL